MTPEQAVDTLLDRHPPTAPALVAVSGGADSVALLHLLIRARERRSGVPPLVVAHLDHGLRDGSGDDAAFVADLARGLGLPCHVGRARLRERGRASEAAARRVRYAYLLRTARRAGASVVLTAHTLDDQAETVLDRLLRGAGPRGLRGILPDRRLGRDGAVRLIRPLLGVRREALRDWLEARSLAWREDPTNHDRGNRRSRIRLDLLPAVESLRPGGIEGLARIARRSREMARLLARETRRLARRAITTENGEISLSREALRKAPEALRWPLLARALRMAGQDPRGLGESTIVEALRIALESRAGSCFDRPPRVRFEVSRSCLRPRRRP